MRVNHPFGDRMAEPNPVLDPLLKPQKLNSCEVGQVMAPLLH
jgi:hypothetical protein